MTGQSAASAQDGDEDPIRRRGLFQSVVATASLLPINDDTAGLRSVLDAMSEGFSLLSPDFIVLDLNVEALRLESRSRDEIVGRSHWELYPGSEEGPLGALYKRAMRDRVTVNLEHRHIWSDGRVSWLEMRAYPTDDGCLAVFFRDVTERHAADRKVRESSERFQAAVHAVAGILWTNDAEGRMVGEQPGWAALTGQSFEDYQDYGWSKAVHPDDVQPTIDAWRKAVAEQSPFVFEHRVRRRDGVWRQFAIRAIPVFNEDGSTREWVGVHSDITDLRRAERRQALFLELADRVRDASDPREIVFAAVELLGKRLQVSRVGYGQIDDDKGAVACEIDYADGVEHLIGEFPLSSFGPRNIDELRRGATVIYSDVTLDDRTRDADFSAIETRAAMAVPLIRNGRLRAALYVNHKTPRTWRPDEVSLAQEVAARTWDALERARAEANLRESETRFRQLAENIDVAFYVNEIDEGKISYVSPAYERIWNQSASEVYADDTAFMRAVHVEDRPHLEAARQRLRAGENAEANYRLVRDDGGVRYIHTQSFVTTNPAGGRRVVGIAEDVTAMTEAHRQLAANAATFETLIRNNPYGEYIVGSDFKMMQTSSAAASAFAGIDPLIGRDLAEILRIIWPEPFATEAIQRFRYTLATGEGYVSPGTVEKRNDSGRTEAYDWRIERIGLPDGTLGVVCYFYDLTERIALEDQLKQALADKDVLIREIDHRVRNSIAMISALLSMQGRASVSQDVKQALDVASARLAAVARIHARLYSGKELGIVEFGSYLEEICADLRTSLGHADIKMAISTAYVALSIDQAVCLGLVANELVTNAFKHCNDRTATISVDLVFAENTLTLTVANTGAQMPKDIDRSKKAGLGMKVIDMLVRQLNGSLASPAAGSAARFQVRMPVAG